MSEKIDLRIEELSDGSFVLVDMRWGRFNKWGHPTRMDVLAHVSLLLEDRENEVIADMAAALNDGRFAA